MAAASLTFLASEVLVKLVRATGQRSIRRCRTTTLTENLVKIVVVILGLLVILNGLGLEITPMLTALGVGGLAVALALQDTLANLFAGLYLTVAKHIRIGNYIQLSSGEEGYLVDIDWRASRLRQLSNNTVLVPNAKLSQSIVTNYHFARAGARRRDRGQRRLCERPRTGRADHEGSGARRDEDRARRRARLEPIVRFHTFGDPGIGFSVILRAQEFVDQFLIKHEFVKRLHKRFAAEGIPIPIKSPRATAHRTAPRLGMSQAEPYHGWVVLLVPRRRWSARCRAARRASGSSPNRCSPISASAVVDYAQLNLWATLDRRRSAPSASGASSIDSAAASCSPRRRGARHRGVPDEPRHIRSPSWRWPSR